MNKPFLKYVGGKTQLLSKIFPYFPNKIENYIEPFIGGGSILIELLDRIESKDIELSGDIIVNDVNINLIDCYRLIKDSPEEFITAIGYLTDNNPEKYYEARIQYNKLKNENTNENKLEKCCLFVYLNKTGFRGMYRESSNGNYNIPYGHYKNPTIIDNENIRRLSILFNKYNVSFSSNSYEVFIKNNIDKLTKDSLIFVDSPYLPQNATTFTKYTKLDFSMDEHKKLAVLLNSLKCNIIATNHSVPFIDENYINFTKEIVNAKRTINAKEPGKTTQEVILSRRTIFTYLDDIYNMSVLHL
jgi:DNA adenine methylase